jgi:hypothetical protein
MYSFAKNKKTVSLFPYIRHICDATTPNLATTVGGRSENRFNRTIPTLICPWENDRLLMDECSVCLTSDLADRGVCLVLNQPFRAKHVVLGYWIGSDEMHEPWFFFGEVLRNQAIGGGFWSVGIELKEFANDDHQKALRPLKDAASRLLPPGVVTE